jgi:hypothetical protein
MRECAVQIRFRDKLNLPSGRNDSMMQSPHGESGPRARDFSSRARFRYAAVVGRYTKYRAAQARGRRTIWWSTFALLAGAAWLAWEQGYFSATGKSHAKVPATNANAITAMQVETQAPSFVSNAPPITSTNSVAMNSMNSTSVPTAAVLPRTNSPPARSSAVLEAQIALDRQGISCGSIDGVVGAQTRAFSTSRARHSVLSRRAKGCH